MPTRFRFSESAFTDSDNDLMEQAFNLHDKLTGLSKTSEIKPGNALVMRPVEQTWLSDMDFTAGYKINL